MNDPRYIACATEECCGIVCKKDAKTAEGSLCSVCSSKTYMCVDCRECSIEFDKIMVECIGFKKFKNPHCSRLLCVGSEGKDTYLETDGGKEGPYSFCETCYKYYRFSLLNELKAYVKKRDAHSDRFMPGGKFRKICYGEKNLSQKESLSFNKKNQRYLKELSDFYIISFQNKTYQIPRDDKHFVLVCSVLTDITPEDVTDFAMRCADDDDGEEQDTCYCYDGAPCTEDDLYVHEWYNDYSPPHNTVKCLKLAAIVLLAGCEVSKIDSEHELKDFQLESLNSISSDWQQYELKSFNLLNTTGKLTFIKVA